MKHTLIRSALAAAIAGTFATSALASTGFYVFGEYSRSDMSSSQAEAYAAEDIQDLRDTTQLLNEVFPNTDLNYTPTYRSDETSNEFGFGVGYRAHANLALELAYRDLGTTSYDTRSTMAGTFNGLPSLSEGGKGTSFESSAIILRAVGILPVTEALSLEGLLGVAYVDTDYTAYEFMNSDIGGVYTERYTASDKGFSATYGVGASYQITPQVGAFARWERIHDVDTDDIWDGIKADTFSGGIRYHF